MSFETIKTIKGHKYRYTVESYRENGKNKQRILKYHGRIDKEPTTGGFNLPDGFYYFTQKGCAGCMSEEELRGELQQYLTRGGLTTSINYIDIKNNPTPIRVFSTPTFCIVDEGKIYIGNGVAFFHKYLEEKLTREKYEIIVNEVIKENKINKKEQMCIEIKNGKKYRELCKMFDGWDDKKLIKELLEESKSKCKGGICPVNLS